MNKKQKETIVFDMTELEDDPSSCRKIIEIKTIQIQLKAGMLIKTPYGTGVIRKIITIKEEAKPVLVDISGTNSDGAIETDGKGDPNSKDSKDDNDTNNNTNNVTHVEDLMDVDKSISPESTSKSTTAINDDKMDDVIYDAYSTGSRYPSRRRKSVNKDGMVHTDMLDVIEKVEQMDEMNEKNRVDSIINATSSSSNGVVETIDLNQRGRKKGRKSPTNTSSSSSSSSSSSRGKRSKRSKSIESDTAVDNVAAVVDLCSAPVTATAPVPIKPRFIIVTQLLWGLLYLDLNTTHIEHVPDHQIMKLPDATPINASDMYRLQPKNYLNDTLMNFAMSSLSTSEVLVTNTYFLETIRMTLSSKTSIYEKKRKLTRLVRKLGFRLGSSPSSSSESDTGGRKHMLIPVNDRLHWSLLMIRNVHKLTWDGPSSANTNDTTIFAPVASVQNGMEAEKDMKEVKASSVSEVKNDEEDANQTSVTNKSIQKSKSKSSKVRVKKGECLEACQPSSLPSSTATSNTSTTTTTTVTEAPPATTSPPTQETAKDVDRQYVVVHKDIPCLVFFDSAKCHRAATYFGQIRSMLSAVLAPNPNSNDTNAIPSAQNVVKVKVDASSNCKNIINDDNNDNTNNNYNNDDNNSSSSSSSDSNVASGSLIVNNADAADTVTVTTHSNHDGNDGNHQQEEQQVAEDKEGPTDATTTDKVGESKRVISSGCSVVDEKNILKKLKAIDLPGFSETVPRQTNDYDCGCFVIEFARQLTQVEPKFGRKLIHFGKKSTASTGKKKSSDATNTTTTTTTTTNNNNNNNNNTNDDDDYNNNKNVNSETNASANPNPNPAVAGKDRTVSEDKDMELEVSENNTNTHAMAHTNDESIDDIVVSGGMNMEVDENLDDDNDNETTDAPSKEDHTKAEGKGKVSSTSMQCMSSNRDRSKRVRRRSAKKAEIDEDVDDDDEVDENDANAASTASTAMELEESKSKAASKKSETTRVSSSSLSSSSSSFSSTSSSGISASTPFIPNDYFAPIKSRVKTCRRRVEKDLRKIATVL